LNGEGVSGGTFSPRITVESCWGKESTAERGGDHQEEMGVGGGGGGEKSKAEKISFLPGGNQKEKMDKEKGPTKNKSCGLFKREISLDSFQKI